MFAGLGHRTAGHFQELLKPSVDSIYTNVESFNALNSSPFTLSVISNLLFTPLPKPRCRTLPASSLGIRFQRLGNMTRQLRPPAKGNDKVTRMDIRGEAGIKLAVSAETSGFEDLMLDRRPGQSEH